MMIMMMVVMLLVLSMVVMEKDTKMIGDLSLFDNVELFVNDY